jgi:uncharacterized protein
LLGMGLLLALAACRGGDTGNGAEQTVANQAHQPGAGEVMLRITTAGGKAHDFIVELAITPQEQERGLMERASLGDNRGMIFPFAFPQTASFWMKNTPLPLDLLFVRTDGTIAAILPGQPEDLHPISAGEPVSAVLEIRQGRAKAIGLAPGDRVQWGDCAAPGPVAGAWRADRFCPAPAS